MFYGNMLRDYDNATNEIMSIRLNILSFLLLFTV